MNVKSWTIKKAESQRIDDFELLENCGVELWCFELWCWRRLLRVPWTARTSNQSILKEISPEYSLEGLMLKLKLQYFGHLMRRADSLEKTLMLGKTEGRRKRGRQRIRWLDGITDSMHMSLSRLWELWWAGRPGVLRFMGSQGVRHNWVTELNWGFSIISCSLLSKWFVFLPKGRQQCWLASSNEIPRNVLYKSITVFTFGWNRY